MSTVVLRGVKRPTETVLGKDHSSGQSKSRCRDSSRRREITEDTGDATTTTTNGCLRRPQEKTPPTPDGSSSLDNETPGKSDNTSSNNTSNSNTCSSSSRDRNGADQVGSRRRQREEKMVSSPISAVDFCSAYLNHKGIRLFLERMKDRDNWHPWDNVIHVSRQPNSRPNSLTLPTEVLDAEDLTDEVRDMIIEIFLENNRLDHLYEVMAYHPEYLHCFLRTHQFLMQAFGPLPVHYRHYVAIMAAARHQCSYLIKVHSKEFLAEGGDETWLKGLEYCPRRLQKLSEISKILAHQPWLITRVHIKQVHGGYEGFTMGEIVQIFIIFAHIHSLCSFVSGCGSNFNGSDRRRHPRTPRSEPTSRDIRPTLECRSSRSHNPSGTTSHPQSPSSKQMDVDNQVGVLVEKLSHLTQEPLTEEQIRERFEKIEMQNSDVSWKTVDEKLSTIPSSSSSPSLSSSSATADDDYLRFVDDHFFCYEDFRSCKRTCGVSTFYERYFSWQADVYQLIARLYSYEACHLDEKFHIAQSLTYYTMGNHADVDTSSFRRAIWCYVHSLFGICHDDFDYSVVDQLIERNLKSYIKTVVCFPERVTRHDYDRFMTGFRHSEKVHVNMMIMEARLQAALLYGFKAVSLWYMNDDWFLRE